MSDIVNSEQPIEEPLTKPKRPRTQKQMEAFEKVKEKRQQNIAVKKQQKLLESAKLLVETEKNKKEGDFNINMYKTTQESELRRLTTENARLSQKLR